MMWLQRMRGEGPDVRDPTDDRWFTPASFLTASGLPVTPELALNLSAIWKGVRTYGDNLGSIPCLMYERLADGDKRRADDHPLYDLLRWQPNSWQTAFEFWEMIAGHCVLRSNAYVEIVEGARGFADQLIPRHPGRMRPSRLPNGNLVYDYTDETGRPHRYTQDEIMHFRVFSDDGLLGRSMVEIGMQSLGVALSAEQYAGRFFHQGAAPAVAVIHPNTLGDEGLANMGKSVERYFSGLAHTHGVLPLEENVKIEKLGIEPEKAQLLATREFSIEELARWLVLPAYALGGTKTPTYASAEAFRQDLVDFSFRPLATRFEQVVKRDLILGRQYIAEFLLEALLRGDLAARAEYYTKALGGAAWESVNGVRRRENLNRDPDPDSDKIRQPLNTATAAPGRPQPPPASRRAERAEAIARDAALRLVRTEIAAATKAAQRFAADGTAWQAWLREFYGDHAGKVAHVLRLPLATARTYAARQGGALAEQGVAAMTDWEWTAAAALAELALDAEEVAC